jgi:putative ABC transport system substrate-binding protein
VAARGARAAVGKLPTIGFLGTSTSLAMNRWVTAFVQRLRELGWIEGRNITIEYRWAEGHTERLPDLANQLVGLKVFDTLHAHHLDVR